MGPDEEIVCSLQSRNNEAITHKITTARSQYGADAHGGAGVGSLQNVNNNFVACGKMDVVNDAGTLLLNSSVLRIGTDCMEFSIGLLSHWI
jgi:hypothetical protein